MVVRIINGKRYNTETATEICDTSNNYGCSDFKHDSSELYVTKKGAFFLCGRGGAMSRWAVSVPGGSTGINVRSIQPIDVDEARDLVERFGTVEDVEKYFPVEDA